MVHQHSIPKAWKDSNVAAIHKKGSKSLTSNYRPVCMESLLLKTAEKVIKSATLEYILQYNLISHSQHGFLPGRSVLSNMIEYLNDLTTAIDQGYAVSSFYSDYAKMFDRISHRLLLHKLKSGYAIQGPLLRWISDWLSERRQRVVINGHSSKWTNVTSSVNQGSVFGPLLAILMSDDIDEVIVHSTISKFADDAKSYKVMKYNDDYAKLQQDINSIAKWAETWGFSLNVEKCSMMHFGSRNIFPTFFVSNQSLRNSLCERDLGIIVSSNLKWSNHVLYAQRKAKFAAMSIVRTFFSRDIQTWGNLFRIYVQPHLDYGLGAWIPYMTKDVNALYSVQRYFTRQAPSIGSKLPEERDEICGLLPGTYIIIAIS